MLDVSSPGTPAEVGFYDSPGYAYGVVVVGELAYVADGEEVLPVLDISNPTTPIEFSSYDTSGEAVNVTVTGAYIYIADEDAGLFILTPSRHKTYVPVII